MFKREMLGTFSYLPKISVLMVISDPDEIWIKRSVLSVLGGIYPNCELCVCDNASSRPHVSESLKGFAASDERVETRRLQKSVSHAEVYNHALSLATGEFVTVLDAGDELSQDALFSVIELLQSSEADVVYADEDLVDIADRHSEPIFKPYWSPDLLLSAPYVGRPCIVRRGLLEDVGQFREGFEGYEEYDLMLRISEKTDLIQHIPRILYHRRTYAEAATGDSHGGESDSVEGRLRAVEGAFERRAKVGEISGSGIGPRVNSRLSSVNRSVVGQPTVSVVDFVSDEKIAGGAKHLAEHSSYPIHELLVSGPESPDASIAGMINLAADKTTGDYLLFLRNYQEALATGWVAELLCQAQRPEVGAVGGRVMGSGGGIRTAGSYSDLSKLTGELLDTPVQEEGSFPLLPVVDSPFNPIVVTLDCMIIRRSTFKAMGGFDEALPTTFYDLDLSFRLVKSGLLNVYTPEAPVTVADRDHPLPDKEEISYMWRRWWTMLSCELHYTGTPLDAGHEVFEDELPLFLQAESGPVR